MHQEIFGVKKHFELKFTIYAIMEQLRNKPQYKNQKFRKSIIKTKTEYNLQQKNSLSFTTLETFLLHFIYIISFSKYSRKVTTSRFFLI